MQLLLFQLYVLVFIHFSYFDFLSAVQFWILYLLFFRSSFLKIFHIFLNVFLFLPSADDRYQQNEQPLSSDPRNLFAQDRAVRPQLAEEPQKTPVTAPPTATRAESCPRPAPEHVCAGPLKFHPFPSEQASLFFSVLQDFDHFIVTLLEKRTSCFIYAVLSRFNEVNCRCYR